MEHIRFNIVSHYDDLALDCLMVKPDHIKAIVQFAHGMIEHKERYIPFMEFLANHGYLCVIHDHRGHGKSIKDIKDLGYFYDGKDIGVVEDIHLINEYLKVQYPSIPYYLFGHSMGSLAVRAYIKKYDDCIDGLFICGSPSYNPLTLFALTTVKVLSKIKGSHYKNSFVDQLSIGSFNKPFKKENLLNAWLTRDKDIVHQYNKDDLCGFSFTMNGYESLFSLMKTAYSSNNWQLNKIDLPIYFISGKDDPCKTSDHAFNQAVLFLKDRGYKNVSFHLFEDMRHEILNEIDKYIVYEDILNTLNQWSQ